MYLVKTKKSKSTFPSLPNKVEVERIYSEDNKVIGYYSAGHWDKQSFAIATNKEHDLGILERPCHLDQIKHGFMRKIPVRLGEDYGFSLLVCRKARGAFPVTYTWED